MDIRPALLIALWLGIAACGSTTPGTTAETPGEQARSMQSFEDEREFERTLAKWIRRAKQENKAREGELQYVMAPPPAMAPADAASTELDNIVVTGSRIEEESITNVQTAGVDEGGIVKRHGDHLVVLRRGRLFTVRIGSDALQPVSMVDAYAPGADPHGAWYDEMLVGGDTVVVVGYSYARGGTELVLFDIARDGALRYRDTYHLRSNDYYSSRNSASRLAGDTLLFYTSLRINPWNLEERDFLPALRHWSPGPAPAQFQRILPATRIYRTDEDLDPFEDDIALHTVTRCDLSKRPLDCTSTAVIGRSGSAFYVSVDSVFVWTNDYDDDQEINPSAVFRIPLDQAPPSALKARGVPIDQLSFLQDGDAHLNVLLTETGEGQGMWGDETASGELALLRIPLSSFGDGSGSAPARAYRRLPGASEGDMQNRYVGDWLLYGNAPYRWHGSGDSEGNPGSVAYAVRYAAKDAVQSMALGHGGERIEAMGGNAIVVGSAGDDLHFTSVRLGARIARSTDVFVQPDAAQGETRSHGFFYRGRSERHGIAGLPIVSQRRGNTMQRYVDETAAVLYLGNRDLELVPMGQLVANSEQAADDACKVSCVDWYGNARPIFIGERVFALMGYELVEGHVSGERIIERRRTSFAPVTTARD